MNFATNMNNALNFAVHLIMKQTNAVASNLWTWQLGKLVRNAFAVQVNSINRERVALLNNLITFSKHTPSENPSQQALSDSRYS